MVEFGLFDIEALHYLLWGINVEIYGQNEVGARMRDGFYRPKHSRHLGERCKVNGVATHEELRLIGTFVPEWTCCIGCVCPLGEAVFAVWAAMTVYH
jgi:hypothetical protein